MSYKNSKCFIITPIGQSGSDVRRETDGIFEAVVKPVLLDLGFQDRNIILPHKMYGSDVIIMEVIQELMTCDIVIANITDANPNVMYEVGIRHALELPLLLIRNLTTSIPFDLQHIRVFDYTNDIAGTQSFKTLLQNMIPSILSDKQLYNPVSIVKANSKGEETKRQLLETQLRLEESTESIIELRERTDELSIQMRKSVSSEREVSSMVYELLMVKEANGTLVFYRDSESVFIQGTFQILTANEFMFSFGMLPEGFHPSRVEKRVALSINSNSSLAVCIHPDGRISHLSHNTGSPCKDDIFSLDIVFHT